MAKPNRENQDDFEFPPAIRAAFDEYPTIRAGREFELRFWFNLNRSLDRYSGFPGLFRRLWEVEIEGVAVWRLAVTMLSGSGLCALALALCMGTSAPADQPPTPWQRPENESALNAMGAFACFRREWEEEYGVPRAYPKAAPPRPKKGGDITWSGSNAHLA